MTRKRDLSTSGCNTDSAKTSVPSSMFSAHCNATNEAKKQNSTFEMSDRSVFRIENLVFEAFDDIFEKFNINTTKSDKIRWIDRYKERFLGYKDKKVDCECANLLESKIQSLELECRNQIICSLSSETKSNYLDRSMITAFPFLTKRASQLLLRRDLQIDRKQRCDRIDRDVISSFMHERCRYLFTELNANTIYK
jgi:hypothetical protein